MSLQLWDVAGHERFGTMTRVYYRYAIAAVIVFDVTRPATFDAVMKWRDDLNSKGKISCFYGSRIHVNLSFPR